MWLVLFAQAAAIPAQTGSINWSQNLLSFVLGGVGGLIPAIYTLRKQQRLAIDDLVLKIIELSMEYPYVEDDAYCSQWKPSTTYVEASVRYESYCCLVFNTIKKAWDQSVSAASCDENRHKYIMNIIDAEELICRHSAWCGHDFRQPRGYGKDFIDYVKYVHNVKCKQSPPL